MIHSCGKFILVGEHAVVYGAQALAFPLRTKRTSLSLIEPPKPTQVTRVEFELGGKSVPHSLIETCSQGLELLGVGPHNLKLKGSSNIPLGAGLGSSAALCVCILRLLAQAFEIDLSAGNLAVLANRLEKRFHGNPSGLDVHTIALEKPIQFSKDFGALPVSIPETTLSATNLLLIDTEIRASTLAMVRVASSYFLNPDTGASIVENFNQIAKKAIEALSSGNDLQLADAMNETQVHLQKAGVSSPRIEEVCELARKSGALATKLTGGGGGGLVLALYPNSFKDKMSRIQSESLKGYESFLAFE